MTPDQSDERVFCGMSVTVAVVTFLLIFSVFMGWLRMPPPNAGCRGFDGVQNQQAQTGEK